MANKRNITERLAKIAKDIRVYEKRTIANVIEIGRLLHEAFETCEHGEYEDWIVEEFGWSDQTALNYRNVYEFNKNPPIQKPNGLAFESVADLNISQSALYLIAGMKRDEQQTARLAVINYAKRDRVTLDDARQIIKRTALAELEAQHEEADQVDGEAPTGTSGFFTVSPPGHDDEDGPEVEYEDDEPEPSKPPSLTQLLYWLRSALHDPQIDFRPAIASLGKPDIREIVKRIQEELNKSESISSISVQAAADRAEFKSKTH